MFIYVKSLMKGTVCSFKNINVGAVWSLGDNKSKLITLNTFKGSWPRQDHLFLWTEDETRKPASGTGIFDQRSDQACSFSSVKCANLPLSLLNPSTSADLRTFERYMTYMAGFTLGVMRQCRFLVIDLC